MSDQTDNAGLAPESRRWQGAQFWPQARWIPPQLESFLAQCEVVVAGTCGGALDELLGLVLLGQQRGTGRWLAWSRAWVWSDAPLLGRTGGAELRNIRSTGFLTIVDWPGEDVAELADIVIKVENAGLLAEGVAIGAELAGVYCVADQIVRRGIDIARIGGALPSPSLQGAIKTTARKLVAGEVDHEGSPLMSWCMDRIRVDADGDVITKPWATCGKREAAPVFALFAAAAVMGLSPSGPRPLRIEP